MNDTRSRMFLFAGLALAALTGVLLYGAVSAAATRPTDDASAHRVDVLVARIDIAPQAQITADMLDRRSYPSDLVPTGAATDPSALIGHRAATAIGAGMPLAASSIEGAAANARRLEPGSVLVAFPTTDVLTTAGLVKAGDRVDILATLPAGTGENMKVTQTILQNVQVMDVTPAVAGTRSLVLLVDHQTALVLKYLRDAPAAVDIVVRSLDEGGTAATTRVDLGYVIRGFGLR